jgi:hypothetical protein
MNQDTTKFLLLAYAPVKVLLKRSESDGRSWVWTRSTGEFWVGTAQLYDTVADCIKGNAKTIKDGIKQYEYEIAQKAKQVEAMKKLLDNG